VALEAPGRGATSRGGFLAHDLVFGATATDLPEDPAVDEVRAETKPGPALTRA